jgi:hypothetical protein
MKVYSFLFWLPFLYYPTTQDGIARVRQATGQFYESVARAEKTHQEAKRIENENWANKVRQRWAIQDEKAKRDAAKRIDLIDLETKRLDAAEKRLALHKRENELIAAGAIPARKTQGMMVDGKNYRTLDEFKQSEDYIVWKDKIADQRAKEIALEIEQKKKEDQATFNMAMRDPNIRAGYMKQKLALELKQVQEGVVKDPWYRVYVLNQNIPWSEWPEEWKKSWKKMIEKQQLKKK